MKKTQTRYIILDKDRGVFLGTYNGEDLGADDGRIYACFAADNPFGLTNSCSFRSYNIAEYFIRDTFSPQRKKHLMVVPVETESEFPSVVDIIKSGYADYTFDMIDGMFQEQNTTVH